MKASTVASRVLTDGTALGGHFNITFACALSFTCKGLWLDPGTNGNVLPSAIGLYVSGSPDTWVHTHPRTPRHGLSIKRFGCVSQFCP